LGFTYNFLSTEHPDFVGTVFNDTFLVTVLDSAGAREVARASVNGSVFSAVSASTAGGSGFDIFTDNPQGVDTFFGAGLPDAGLTGFLSASVLVVGGQTVTLEFSIEDRGDGILDSAVVVDNLTLSSVEVVDVNSSTFLVNGSIVADPQVLAVGGAQRVGAAADGVTKLLLRSLVAGPGTANFCLMDGLAPEDGGLAVLGGSGRQQCVTSSAVSTPRGFIAFAVYQTPEEFNRGGANAQGDQALATRPLRVQVTFTPTGGQPVVNDVPLLLARPPVVLVHGIWSAAGTWQFALATDPRFAVTPVGYEPTRAASFATNKTVPFDHNGIQAAVLGARQLGIAATQVDVVGHSMGGILSRNFVATPEYLRNNNYMAGDINKLVTLNTPHTGSPLANLANLIRATPVVGPIFEGLASKIDMPVHLGAVDDLANGSVAINAIEHTPVPGHAMVGTGGSTALALLPGKLGALYRVINFFADSSTLFQALQHDGIVGRLSQEGGLPAGAITTFPGLDSVHTLVTQSTNYSNALIGLLNQPASGSMFAQFPAPATLDFSESSALPPDEHAPVMTAASVSEGLAIGPALDGTISAPGQTVHVVVQANAGVSVDRVLLVGPGLGAEDPVSPFEFDVVIPDDSLGDFALSAVGVDGAGNLFTSNSVTLRIAATSALQSVDIIPGTVTFVNVGEATALSVLGSFDDGIVRSITGQTTGTIYSVSDPSIASVSPAGVVTAVSGGTTVVVARNGSRQDSITVNVLLDEANQPPIANAGSDQTVVVNTQIILDGTGSFDPDGGPDPLAYEWLQIGGPVVTLTNPTAATPSFTLSVPGTYVFSLVVRDGVADSAADAVTITTASSATITVSPSTLNFAGTNMGGVLNPITPPQTVTVAFSVAGAVTWSASANQSWVQLTGASGTGSGSFTVGIINPGGILPTNVLGGQANLSATITVTSNVANSPQTVAVNLNLQAKSNFASPIGLVDTPLQNTSNVVGAIAVTGWVVDDVGIASVQLYRNCLVFEPAINCQMIDGQNVVFIGDATLVPGARPDIEALFPTYPSANVGAWGYLLLTSMLPHIPNAQMFGGQGPLTLSIFATDLDGHVKQLGRTQVDTTATAITMGNDTITKPFGAIDTPGQGATISGAAYANFGWALTPDGNTVADAGDIVVPTNGSTMSVLIDGAPVGTVSFNQCRGTVLGPVPGGVFCDDDVSNIFGNPTPLAPFTPRTSNPTRHRNLDAGRGPIGAFILDTTALTNGIHTIMWLVFDDAGRGEGIGSRFFNVLNGSSLAANPLATAALATFGTADELTLWPIETGTVWGRHGVSVTTPLERLEPDGAGQRLVRMPAQGRLEVRLGDGLLAGYLVANGTLRALPPGSHLDPATGVFTWHPMLGYLGTYQLTFLRDNDTQVPLTVTLEPDAIAAGHLAMALDRPASDATVSGSFTVEGWALDTGAWQGAGIGAVHVWAQRVDVPAADPAFLGAAILNGARSDVAAIYGTQFDRAGWALSVSGLAPGTYDITAYVWRTRTQQFEDARTLRITVK
jgi:pimeloyl-ACP methyl ester carboxylesterase